MSNKEPGYVYILINPSFREDRVKIGKNGHPVDVLSKAKKVYKEGFKIQMR